MDALQTHSLFCSHWYLNCPPKNLEHSSLYTVHHDILCKTHDTTQDSLFLRQSMQEMHSQYDEIEKNHIGRQIVWSQDANGKKSLNWSECIWSCPGKKLKKTFQISIKSNIKSARVELREELTRLNDSITPILGCANGANQFEVAKPQAAATSWSAQRSQLFTPSASLYYHPTENAKNGPSRDSRKTSWKGILDAGCPLRP